MSIVRWRPTWDALAIEKFFEDVPMTHNTPGFTPALDIYQDANNVFVETPLAGINPEKVEVTIENDILKIEGKSEHKSEVDEKNYYRREVRTGSFYREVAMPTNVQGDKAEAVFENGMLRITIPKTEAVKPKSIKVLIKNNK
ncbi:Hsp20/alpha crystallin family protein [Patescibacteria group bacterium]|nr:Hsp20/alpha crystallin family protein [Patescibacteria group bacterium]